MELARDAADAKAFFLRLDQACRATGLEALGWALLPTHYHLVVRGTGAALAAAMHRLNRSYARAFNRRHGGRGHLYESAYRAYPKAPWQAAHDVRAMRLLAKKWVSKGPAASFETAPRLFDVDTPEAMWESETRFIHLLGAPEGIDAKALALHVASGAGVPPRVSAPVLGFSSALYAGLVVSRWEDRLDRDSLFAEQVMQWRTRHGL